MPSLRFCASCSQPLGINKRPHAIYCDRKCKASASEKRRPKRDDHARYLNEREQRLQSVSRYQRENPHVPKRAKRKRKALIAGAGVFVVSSRDWLRLVRRYDGRCFYCKADGRMSMDHVIPISRGGRHSIGNLVPACVTCNSSKRNRTITEWKRGAGSARITAAALSHDRANVG